MAVKAAMGQIGRFHDIGNADAANPLARNKAPAASIMRSRCSAAFSRLTRMEHLGLQRPRPLIYMTSSSIGKRYMMVVI